MKHVDFPHKSEFLPIDKAVKIKCRYCDLADICHRREIKEQYEATGITTRCVMTPNRPGSNRKKKRSKKRS